MEATELNASLSAIIEELDGKGREFVTVSVPSRKAVIEIIKNFQQLIFPSYFKRDGNAGKTSLEIIAQTKALLERELSAAYSFCGTQDVDCEKLALDLLSELPKVKEMLLKDIKALYEGDPAANTEQEIIVSYPGFYAICIYRIAHCFYMRKVPYISRIMTEYAHEKTGVDIHAGATIGEYFFIDHGTGIVIGETTTIGNNVKLYQGVTLGAKSFELDEDGNPVKGIKRHPNIGDNCIIYANATILGGNTNIGEGTVIGGNVWLTHSVPPMSVIYYEKK